MVGRDGQMMIWIYLSRSRRVAMATAHHGAQELANSRRALLPKRNQQIGATIFDAPNFGLLLCIAQFCKFVVVV